MYTNPTVSENWSRETPVTSTMTQGATPGVSHCVIPNRTVGRWTTSDPWLSSIHHIISHIAQYHFYLERTVQYDHTVSISYRFYLTLSTIKTRLKASQRPP